MIILFFKYDYTLWYIMEIYKEKTFWISDVKKMYIYIKCRKTEILLILPYSLTYYFTGMLITDPYDMMSLTANPKYASFRPVSVGVAFNSRPILQMPHHQLLHLLLVQHCASSGWPLHRTDHLYHLKDPLKRNLVWIQNKLKVLS